MRPAALALMLPACTLETAGVADLVEPAYQAGVSCPSGDRGLPDGAPSEVEGWTCESRRDGQLVSIGCRRDQASFRVFCDAAEGGLTSAVQIGACVMQVWCG